MTKIYLAARYSRNKEMCGYAFELEKLGYHITSRWIKGDHDIRAYGQSKAPEYMPLWAEEDWQDLMAADIVISFTEPRDDIPGRARGGRHCEFGIALACSKTVVVVGYRENVFHWLPQVNFYETWNEFVNDAHLYYVEK